MNSHARKWDWMLEFLIRNTVAKTEMQNRFNMNVWKWNWLFICRNWPGKPTRFWVFTTHTLHASPKFSNFLCKSLKKRVGDECPMGFWRSLEPSRAKWFMLELRHTTGTHRVLNRVLNIMYRCGAARVAQWLALLPHSKKVLGSFPAQPGPFCVEFACSPRVCVGFLRVLRFPPTSKDMHRQC